MKVKRLNVILSLAIVILCLFQAVRYYNQGDLSNFWVEMGAAISIGALGVRSLVERQDLRKGFMIVAIIGLVISGRYLLLGT